MGVAHCLALDSEGGIWSWGRNTDGQLGLGHTDNCPTPVKITLRKKIISISAGDIISGAMSDNGEIFLWGGVFYWPTLRVVFPQQFLFPEKISSFSLGRMDFCFLTETGKIHYRKYNPSQTGDDGSFKIMDFSFGSEIVKISLSSHYFLALTDSRNMFEWGDIRSGESGVSQLDDDEPVLVPCKFTPLQSVKTVRFFHNFSNYF
jgi:alpha-tubulin suppressor-like RCC1 family protein